MSNTMDKQQAAREAFEAFASKHMNKRIGDCFLRDCNDVDPQRTYEKFETEEAWLDWQAAQAALMPALVEARDALLEAKQVCAHLAAAEWEQAEALMVNRTASKAIARINAIIGSFPEGKRPLSCNETGDKK